MECSKYETMWDFVISKFTDEVIIEAKDLIHKCLNCSFHKISCRDWYELVKFLDDKKNKNDERERETIWWVEESTEANRWD